MTTESVRFHEAAHFVAMCDVDMPATELEAIGDRGLCRPARDLLELSCWDRAFVTLAGCYGPRLCGVNDDLPSIEDHELGLGSLSPREVQSLRQHLSNWVWEREKEILVVVAALGARPRLDRWGIAEVVHGSPRLAAYQHLYDRPSTRKPAAAMSTTGGTLRGLQRVTCSAF